MAEKQDKVQKNDTSAQQACTPNHDLCHFYRQGRCYYGNRCKFVHRNPESPVRNPSAVSRQALQYAEREVRHASIHPRRQDDVEQKSKRVCWQWKDGNCNRGASCRFSHAAPVPIFRANEEEVPEFPQQQPNAQTAGQLTTQNGLEAAIWKRPDARATQGAYREAARQKFERKGDHHQEAARQREIRAQREQLAEALRMEREASVTAQHVLGSTLITYEAGIGIRRVVGGFDSCRLTLTKLPPETRREEIITLFARQGVDSDSVYILDLKAASNSCQATVLTSKDHAGAIVGLDSLEFKSEQLCVEMNENASREAMGESTQNDPDVLTITWRAPSAAMIVTYDNMDLACQKAQALDKTFCRGRRVKVDLLSALASTRCDPPAIKLVGLPSDISLSEVEAFTESSTVKRLKSNEYNLQEAFDVLRQHLHVHGMTSFDIVSQDRADGLITVRTRFESLEHAARACDSIRGKRLRPGYPIFQLSLAQSLLFVSTIPSQQYRAQKHLWDSLSCRGDDRAAHLRIQENKVSGKVFIRVMGDDKKAVGALKVRVETLVAGERLDVNLWHRSFTFSKGRDFLAKIYADTGVYVRCDFKVHALKMYGDGQAKEEARQMLTNEIARLALLEFIVNLTNRRVIGYFIRSGLAALKEIVGEDSATMDLTSRPCKLAIRGGEEARHALTTIMDRAFTHTDTDLQSADGGNDTCPVCGDKVSTPVKLGCKHVYCTICIRHYLTTAAGSKIFPLACVGDDAKCNAPIPIPVIKRFLTQQQYEHLIEVALSTYLDEHPKDFRYCTTPDCTQIYRTDTNTMLMCPACFAEVCSSCHEEAHEGMTCEERRDRKAQEEERLNTDWAAANGVKKCPSCQVWIEKTEGCNHVACKCGTHICWTCMGAFPSGEIYTHMRGVHGRISDAQAPHIDDDYRHALALQRELNAQGRVRLDIGPLRPDYVERAHHHAHVLALRRQEEEDRRRAAREADNLQLEIAAREEAAEQRVREANRGCVIM